MKTTAVTAIILAAGLACGRAADEKPATEKPAATFKSQAEKISYALGILIGNNIKQQSIDADPDVLAKGIKDMQAGKPSLTIQEAQQTMMAYQTEQRAKLSEKDRAYLAENAKKEGVKTTPPASSIKSSPPARAQPRRPPTRSRLITGAPSSTARSSTAPTRAASPSSRPSRGSSPAGPRRCK